MPASVTSRTVPPSATASTSSGVRSRSLPSKYETTRPPTLTPRSDASRRRRRVSSAATTSADASSSASRGEASAARPMGVAARTSTGPSCQRSRTPTIGPGAERLRSTECPPPSATSACGGGSVHWPSWRSRWACASGTSGVRARCRSTRRTTPRTRGRCCTSATPRTTSRAPTRRLPPVTCPTCSSPASRRRPCTPRQASGSSRSASRRSGWTRSAGGSVRRSSAR